MLDSGPVGGAGDRTDAVGDGAVDDGAGGDMELYDLQVCVDRIEG